MNTTEDTQQLTFSNAEARPMPTLICVGTVGDVGNGKVSSSEKYIVQPVNIDGLDAGRNHKVYFLYRPEWLVPGFRPNKLQEQDSGAFFVYSKNIAGEDAPSILRGLAGSDEKFEALAGTLLSLPVDAEIGGPSIEDVEKTLRTFFNNNVGPDGDAQKIGYTLQQESEPTGETDANGKKVYAKKRNYVLDRNNPFFDVTVKNLKSKAKYAASREDGSVKMTYSSNVPF